MSERRDWQVAVQIVTSHVFFFSLFLNVDGKEFMRTALTLSSLIGQPSKYYDIAITTFFKGNEMYAA